MNVWNSDYPTSLPHQGFNKSIEKFYRTWSTSVYKLIQCDLIYGMFQTFIVIDNKMFWWWSIENAFYNLLWEKTDTQGAYTIKTFTAVIVTVL